MRKVRISATMRIAIGLAFISATVLIGGLLTSIIPDAREASITGRKDLCEALAVAASVHAKDYEFEKIQSILNNIVERNQDILSAALRRKGGEIIVEVGDHRNRWQVDPEHESSFEHLFVPVVTGNQDQWGQVELRFKPVEVRGLGLAGMLRRPVVRMFLFFPAASLALFFLYLQKMLRHMDPSKVVPGRVRTAMDTLAGGLLVVDQDHRIALANGAFAAWLEKTPDELIGVGVRSLPWEQAGDDDECPWSRAINTRVPQLGIAMRLRVGETQKVFVTNCTPIAGHNDQIRGALASFEDVTELENKKVELQESREEADRANAAKSEFLALMSHEIRTPMNAILGFTDVLRRGFDDTAADREEYLNTIHASGQYLLAVINDILDLSKVESGRLDVEQVKCSPHRIIHEVIQALNVKAEEKGITLCYEPTDDVPETIISDSVRVRQIITNLVGNAIKFTDKGGVRLVSRFESTVDGPALLIDVIDSGIGMPPNALEKVFQPFAQADASTTRKFGGTGLGLAISRRFAEALGGDVTVSSEEGKGSTFTVQLATGPTAGVKLLTAEEAENARLKQPERKKSEFRLPKSKILVVDDGIANQKLLKLTLTRAGADVDVAENGEVGVEMVQVGGYDVVFMDMQMPVLDGYSATSLLRQQGYSLPIIALTGNAMQGDAEKCFNAGCTGFLPKPVDLEKLMDTLKEVLGVADSEDLDDVEEVSEPNLEEPTAVDDTASDSTASDDTGDDTADDTGDDTADEFALADSSADPPTDCQREVDLIPERIPSSLPVEDEEIREIVEEFLERLGPKVREMRRAGNGAEFDTLAEMGHWLKGAAPTVGFESLAAPALALESGAKAGDLDQIEKHLDEIEYIVARVCVATNAV